MFAVALLIGAVTGLATGRTYDRCELARDLQLLGVDREHIATWVCIAYHESRYDTAAQNYGSGDHGLLQISELYWCGPGKACGAPCSAFRDEDISDDVKCALQIYKEHTRLQGDGFLAWVVYPHHCKQNAKKYIIDCDKNIKNTTFKYEDRARHLKTDIRYDLKPKIVDNPYRNAVTPRYLSINSIFQGSYVDEFEKNYYENSKQSNWQNFKLDNIDDLQLPPVVSEKQWSYYIKSTSRPATVTTLDAALKGIKPPSPKKIESNQFRRRKTFSQPQFLKNRFSDDQETSKTTPAPVRHNSERSYSLNEDLSHNIFLNLSPSVISKSLSEFPSLEIKSSDLSRYHVKTPQLDESPSSAVLSYDDLAQNPFLNSLPAFNGKSRTKSPFQVTNFGQNNFRGFTITTSRPVAFLRSSKQIGRFDDSEVNSNIRESSQSSQTDEDTNISIADLTQNPFLSHLFRVNTAKPSTESTIQSTAKNPSFQDKRGNYRKEFSFSTTKPSTKFALSYSPEEDVTSRRERLEKSTKTPTTVQRGRDRYSTDNIITENNSIESSTTAPYSTRRYQTISRQRFNTNPNDYKSTTAIQPVTEKQTVSTTSKSYTNDFNRRTFKIETTTPRTTTTLNATEINRSVSKIQKEGLPRSVNRTEITGKTQTTRKPETVSRLRAVDRTEITSRSQNVSVSQTTSRRQTTSSIQTVSRLGTTDRPQIVNKTESTSTRQTNSSIITASASQTTRRPQPTSRLQTTSNRLQTTSRPLTTSRLQTTSNRLQTTSRQLTTSRLQTTNNRLQTTSRPLKTSRLQTTSRPETSNNLQVNITDTISRPQTTSKPEITKGSQTTIRPEITSRPSTTLRSWSSWRVREEPRNNTLTTPRPAFTWPRPNTTVTSTTRSYSTTQKPSISSTEALKPSSTSNEAQTAKTTQSIFDLYLRPSSQAPFKPLEFTFNKLRRGISIFSDGTTKPPHI